MNMSRFRQNAVVPGHPFLTLARWTSWSIHCALQREAVADFQTIPQKMTLIPKIRNFGSTSIFIKRDYYEPELLACKDFILPGGLVIDVGASFGIYTLFFANFVGPEGHVLSFEPGALSFSMLKKNISNSGLENVDIHNVALSDEEGDRKLFYIANSPVNFSLGGTAEMAGEVVKTATLDSLMRDRDERKLCFIKMDVEGYEKFVIDGSARTISSARPVIMFEVSNSAVARAGLSELEPFELLQNLNYRFFAMKDRFFAVQPPMQGNIFAVPAERVCNFHVLRQN